MCIVLLVNPYIKYIEDICLIYYSSAENEVQIINDFQWISTPHNKNLF